MKRHREEAALCGALPQKMLGAKIATGISHVDVPPSLWATGGLEVVSIKITPLPTLSPGLRSEVGGSVAGEHGFRQMI